MHLHELPTPALLIVADLLDHNHGHHGGGTTRHDTRLVTLTKAAVVIG